MALTIDDVKHVAKLARLAMNDDELKLMLNRLNALMEHFERLQELDTTDVEPTSHSFPVMNVFRDDVAKESLSPESFLSAAPSAEDSLFIVPRIVEDDSNGTV